jgi:hypothetical protein
MTFNLHIRAGQKAKKVFRVSNYVDVSHSFLKFILATNVHSLAVLVSAFCCVSVIWWLQFTIISADLHCDHLSYNAV